MSTLKKNITYNFVYQFLILILPFITAPYISRTIGAKGIGTYSFAQSIALYFSYICVLGLNNYGNRAIAAVQNDRKKRSKIFSEIYTMQVTTSIIGIILYIIYIIFIATDIKSAIIMLGLVISSGFDINWFFFGMEQFKLTITRNTLIKIFSVICIFLFIHNENDVYKYILIMMISSLISQLALWPYLKKFIEFKKVKWIDVKKHYKENFILFIPIILVSVYKIMDKVMLGYFKDVSQVGYYENAEKIITMIESVIVAVGTVMLPRISVNVASKNEKNEKEYFDFFIKCAIMYSFATIWGLNAIKDSFVDIYFGQGFQETATIIGTLSITIIFFGLGNVLRTQYLIPHKLDYIYLKSAGIGAFVNLVINLCLIPKYGANGAAIATVFAESIVCIYQFYKSKKDVKLKRYIKELIYYFIAGLCMFLIIKLINFGENKIIILLLDIIVGIIIYSIFVILKNLKVINKWIHTKFEKSKFIKNQNKG